MRKTWTIEQRVRGQNQLAKQAGARHNLTVEQWMQTWVCLSSTTLTNEPPHPTESKSDSHQKDDCHFAFIDYLIACGSPKMKLSITATSTSPAPSAGPSAPVP